MNATDIFIQARGLLIDLDGTLIDSTGPVHRAWSAFARRHGLDPVEVTHFAQGRPSAESIRLLLTDAAPAVDIDLDAEARRHEATEVADCAGVSALSGAAEILADPRPLAIVTSCSRALAEARLSAAGLPVPVQMITSDDVEHGKPHPEPFQRGAALLGLTPGESVALEDAPAGVRAAQAAGARVIAAVSTHAAAELADADAVIGALSELIVAGRPMPGGHSSLARPGVPLSVNRVAGLPVHGDQQPDQTARSS